MKSELKFQKRDYNYLARFTINGDRKSFTVPLSSKASYREQLIEFIELSVAVTNSHTEVRAAVLLQIDEMVAKLKSMSPDSAVDDLKRLKNKGLRVTSSGRNVPTNAELYDEFKAFKTPNVASNTLDIYEQSREFLFFYFGDDRLCDELTREDVISAYGKATQEKIRRGRTRDGKEVPLAPKTVMKRIDTLRAMFNFAISKKYVRDNPFARLGIKVEAVGPKKKFISLDLFKQIYDAMPDENWRTFITFARFAGFRCPSEPMELEWDDIDFESGEFSIWDTKRKRWRHKVSLFPELRQQLELQKSLSYGSQYVISDPQFRNRAFKDVDGKFDARGRTAKDFKNSNLRTDFEKYLNRAGIKNWHKPFHSMRSTRASELMHQGYTPKAVCDWLGMSLRMLEQNYSQVVPDEQKAAKHNATLLGFFERKSA